MCNLDIVDYAVCTVVILSCSLCKKSSPLPKSNDYVLTTQFYQTFGTPSTFPNKPYWTTKLFWCHQQKPPKVIKSHQAIATHISHYYCNVLPFSNWGRGGGIYILGIGRLNVTG